jgi:hypothetical protein
MSTTKISGQSAAGSIKNILLEDGPVRPEHIAQIIYIH